MISSQDLLAKADEYGASFSGVADLVPATAEIDRQGGPELARYPRAVSVGIRLPSAIVDRIGDQDDQIAIMSYQFHGYEAINTRLNTVVSRIASDIQAEGYDAFPIAAAQTIDKENHQGAFSNKLAAHMAGLGWIGKSCLLVTPQVGPRVRWATVLTDAPIDPTGMPMDERCGSCTECVDICPVHAFTGRPFREDEPRSMRFDVFKCRAHQQKLEEEKGFHLCGLCLYVCPHGRSGSK